MHTASTISSPSSPPAPEHSRRGLSTLRAAEIGALTATAANVTVWVVGTVADVGFEVTPIGVDSPTQVGVVMVALTTLLAFGLGSALLALASRRSVQRVRLVAAAGAVFAVVSTAGPLSTAEDLASGVLLAAMHLVTGAEFLATARKVRGR